MLFKYRFKHNVTEMSLVFKNSSNPIPMKRCSKSSFEWNIEIDLEKGVYFYKYAINSIIRFNDPVSKEYYIDESGEVWSVINVESTDINHKLLPQKTCFYGGNLQIIKPNYVILTTNLHCTKDVHSVSLMWNQGNGQLIKFEEHSIHGTPDNNSFLQHEFILDTSNIHIVPGIYRVILFIDGEQVYTNYFEMLKCKNISENYINIAI